MSTKQEIIKGVVWSSIQKYSGMIVSLIVSAILARILSPTEFGIVAIANVLIWFFSMFSTMGIGPAIIQRKDLSQQDLNNIFTFTFYVGIIIALIFFFSSWFIAYLYNNEKLIFVCQLLSLNLFFATINMVPGALMSKNLRFKENAIRTLLLQILTGIISVITAYKGLGIYSLLISPIITPLGTFIYNRKFYPISLSSHLSLEPIKRIFSFSAYQFLFELVIYFSRNLDKIIIGKSMNLADLGYYEKSYRLMQLPIQNVSSVISPVLQPIFSRNQESPQFIGEKYNKIIKLLSIISFPLMAFLVMSSREIINLFYGKNWDAAIPIFNILAISISFNIIQSTANSIYISCNQAKLQFQVALRNSITTIIGFIIALFFFKTVTSIAWAWSISLIINFIFTFHTLYNKVLKLPYMSMIKLLISPAICSILICMILFSINKYIETNYLSLLIIKIIISFLVTIVFIEITGLYNIKTSITNRLNKQ